MKPLPIAALALISLMALSCQHSPASTPSEVQAPRCQNDAQCLRPWHPGVNGCVPQLTCVTGQCIPPASQTGQKNRATGTLTFDVGQGPKTVWIEVADDDYERAKGLMCRTELLREWGMLFIMPRSTVQRFWMKNTLISLDMLFIDENWQVVGIIKNVPPLNLESRGVDLPSLYVLELKAGEAARLGLFAGMQLTYTAPPE